MSARTAVAGRITSTNVVSGRDGVKVTARVTDEEGGVVTVTIPLAAVQQAISDYFVTADVAFEAAIVQTTWGGYVAQRPTKWVQS